jgi:hypothetical protein
LFFGARFVVWYLNHWSQFQALEADPVDLLTHMWFQVRWALLGMALFGVTWCWALLTSLSIVSQAGRASGSGLVQPPPPGGDPVDSP